MRKSRYTLKKEKRKAQCSAAGRASQLVQARRRMERAETVWSLVREIHVKRGDGSVVSVWKVYATSELDYPLAVEFGGEIHRYMSACRLGPLIARKMLEVAA
jgi:hypothetical protein